MTECVRFIYSNTNIKCKTFWICLVMIKIAIIDSGLDLQHPHFHSHIKKNLITGIYIRCSNYDDTDYLENFDDNFGHGTACAGIVSKHVPEASLIIIKIFDNEGVVNEKALFSALKYCIINDVNIINISLGIQTATPPVKLKQLCDEAHENEIIIVAAEHNKRIESYPAYYPEVFGVAAGNIKKSNQYGLVANSPIKYVAKGGLQRVMWKNGGYNIVSGTSYSCAHLTGIIGRAMIDSGISKYDEIKFFLDNSASLEASPIYGRKPDATSASLNVVDSTILENLHYKYFSIPKFSWLGKLAVFPVSEKEIGSIFRFKHLARDVCMFIDYPKTIKIKLEKDQIITRRLTEEDLNKFDTLVLGYFHEHLFEANLSYGMDLVDQAIQAEKNFVVFDFVLRDIIQKKVIKLGLSNKIYTPEVGQDTFLDFVNFKHLPKVTTPVLVVIGTGSRQGKFTTQLRIKQILQDMGYRIAHISTEPHGEILGANFSFPIGYNNTVNISSEDKIQFLKYLMKGVQEFIKPDLILSGVQGSLIPLSKTYEGDVTLPISFLYGTQADAFICTISPDDTLERIKRNTDTAKFFTGSTVLFYCLCPFERSVNVTNANGTLSSLRQLNEDEFQSKCEYLSQELGAPVVNIMSVANDNVVLQTITNFFS